MDVQLAVDTTCCLTWNTRLYTFQVQDAAVHGPALAGRASKRQATRESHSSALDSLTEIDGLRGGRRSLRLGHWAHFAPTRCTAVGASWRATAAAPWSIQPPGRQQVSQWTRNLP